MYTLSTVQVRIRVQKYVVLYIPIEKVQIQSHNRGWHNIYMNIISQKGAKYRLVRYT